MKATIYIADEKTSLTTKGMSHGGSDKYLTTRAGQRRLRERLPKAGVFL
jgi:hypothetical protein